MYFTAGKRVHNKEHMCQGETEYNEIYGAVAYYWPDAFSGTISQLPCEYNVCELCM